MTNQTEGKLNETTTNESTQGTERTGSEESSQEINYTEFEQEQMKLGWNPSGSKSAEQWAGDYPLFKKIKELTAKQEKAERLLENMAKNAQKAEEYGYKKAYAELEAQKEQAIRQGDVQAVRAVEQEQNKLATNSSGPINAHPAIKEFTEKYSDILNCAADDYKRLKILSDLSTVDKNLMSKQLDPATHMKHLENYLHTNYPDHFKQEEPFQAVEGNTNSSGMNRGVKKKFTYNDLSSEQKEMANYLKNSKLGKSIDDYIKDLVKFGDLK
jgi:hypothetical protein